MITDHLPSIIAILICLILSAYFSATETAFSSLNKTRIKVLAEDGGYRYSTMDKSEQGMNERLIRMLLDSVVDMQSANNLIVIRTLPGSAHVAGEAVDSLKWTEILGTIAGDNTILVIVRSTDEVDAVMRRFRSIIK